MPEATKRLRGIILTVTEQCNLRCEYCYVPVERGRTMTAELADRAIDWFVANAVPEGPLGLSFFGGEPFLARQQLQRTTSRLRGHLPPDRRVRVIVPTNALAMSDDDASWCRQQDVELAISIDGSAEPYERRHANGSVCQEALMRAVPAILRGLTPGTALARMTVTPANVGSLCANVRALGRMGFERIVYLPDYGASWDDTATETWRREHQRLATWLLGAQSAGKKAPELPAWKAIEARLLRRLPRRRCGAGIDNVTVAPDGELFPCYRFAYAKDARDWRLGDIRDGIVAPEKVARLESADADHLHPERGSCDSCPAADGCTHHCPAVGFITAGDVEYVPDTICRLMVAQVAAVRELCAARKQTAQPKAIVRSWTKAAAVVAGLAACQNQSSLQPRPDASDTNQTRDVGIGGGICAVQFDRDALAPADVAIERQSADSQAIDGDDVDTADAYYIPIGGVCPVMLP